MFSVFLGGCQKAYFQKCVSQGKSMTAICNLKSMQLLPKSSHVLFVAIIRKKYSIYVKNQEPCI